MNNSTPCNQRDEIIAHSIALAIGAKLTIASISNRSALSPTPNPDNSTPSDSALALT